MVNARRSSLGKKAADKLLDEYQVSTGPSFGRRLLFLISSLLVTLLPLIPYTLGKGLPLLSYLRDPWSVQIGDLAVTTPEVSQLGFKEFQLPATPLLVIGVSLLNVLALSAAYHNQAQAQELRIGQLRKADGRVSVVTPQIEASIKTSALYYALFYVNALFTCIWAFLGLGVFGRLDVILNYGFGMALPGLLVAFLTKPTTVKK